MALVVFGKKKFFLKGFFVASYFCQLVREHGFLKQLFFEPERYGCFKRLKTAGGKGQIGFQKPLELCKRFFEKDDVIDLIQTYASLFKAESYRLFWKARIVF